MPAKSIKQQRFMGMVRRAQKTGQASSPEVAEVAASMKKKDAKDFASTKHKGLPMKKEEFINEEDYDRMKDRRMERGGVGGNQRYSRPPAKKLSNAELGIKPGKTQLQKDAEKKHGKGKSAMDIVRAEIEAKHGKGAIMKTKKEELELEEGKKKGLWDRIHAKRKRGERPAKPGEKDYPETLKVEDVVAERADTWHPDPEKDRKLGGPGANQRAREDRAAASKPKEDPKKLKSGESYMDYAKRQKKSSVKYSPEIQKRLDAAKAKKKEGIVGKVMRKVGLKKEGIEGKTYKQFVMEANQ